MAEFVRLEVSDGVGTIRLDRPKMNALNVQVQEEIRAAAAEATSRDDVKAVVVYGGERVFAAGADIKEMADMSYVDMVQRSGALQSAFTQRGPHPQARRRGDHRLRPGRRLRAGAVRRRPLRRRGRRARSARDPARHHPGRRRHPAAVPPGRARAAPRTSSSRGRFVKADEALAIGLVDRVVPADQVYAEAVAWAGQFTHAATLRRTRGEGVDRPRARVRPRHRAGHRAAAVRGPVRHRGPHDRDDVVRRERPGQGRVSPVAEWCPNAPARQRCGCGILRREGRTVREDRTTGVAPMARNTYETADRTHRAARRSPTGRRRRRPRSTGPYAARPGRLDRVRGRRRCSSRPVRCASR